MEGQRRCPPARPDSSEAAPIAAMNAPRPRTRLACLERAALGSAAEGALDLLPGCPCGSHSSRQIDHRPAQGRWVGNSPLQKVARHPRQERCASEVPPGAASASAAAVSTLPRDTAGTPASRSPSSLPAAAARGPADGHSSPASAQSHESGRSVAPGPAAPSNTASTSAPFPRPGRPAAGSRGRSPASSG
jgi:hypothetical protein